MPGNDGPTKPWNWRKVFRDLAKAHNWTPQMVGELTFYQLFTYIVPEDSLGGYVKSVSPFDALASGKIKDSKKGITFWSNDGPTELRKSKDV